MTKSRMESFSDGVIAVAITLLILNIGVPDPGHLHKLHESLGTALGDKWPEYAAYVTSFITIGIIWINHHAMVGRLREVTHVILFLNLVLLMTIVLLPFATALMATYLTKSSGQHLAAAVYGGSLLLMAGVFSAMNAYILERHPEMLNVSFSPEHRRSLLIRGVGGSAPYLLATALAPISAVATLVICAGVAVFYALPVASRVR